MQPIASFSGLASGIQWRDMVEQIIKLESSRRLSPVTSQIRLQTQRNTAWGEYSSLVTKLRDASKSFSDGSAFGVFKTSVSNSAVSGRALVSATANEKASPGTYDVEVLQLAQAEKWGSAEITDPAANLALAGTFHVNGRAVTLADGDSLTALRDKINAANTGSNASGVTATILSTSSTSHRLILTADNSGSRGIELVDSTSGVLKDAKLGILTGTQTSNSSTAESGWTDSIRFSSRSEVLKDVLGLSPPPAVSNILVGGVQVEIDFNNDTLDEVLAKIQAADPLAKMREEVVNGKTMYRLSTSQTVAVDPSSAESQRNLELLGFVKNTSGSQITVGQDAKFQVDGYSLTRRSNTVTDAIEGVTLNLLATDAASRTFSVTGSGLSVTKEAKGIDAGTYAVSVTATARKDATTSTSNLSVATPIPSTVTAGTYGVSITALATVASQTGTGFDGSYDQKTGASPDWIQITDGAGKSATVNLATGEGLATILKNLNDAFSANGVAMTAVDSGGQLRLESTTAAGSSSTFSVTSSSTSVQTNLGIADGAYTGTNIQGTIGGYAATGSGSTLTADSGTAVAGLQVTYSGASTGLVGSVTISDTSTVTGATIDGEAVDVDSATNKIIGKAGSRFEGLELTYTGPGANGYVGDLVVEGDISVDVKIERDVDATAKKVEELVGLYNEMTEFVKKQRDTRGPLGADSSLRAMLGSLRDVLFKEVSGLSATNPYTRVSLAGVEFTRQGTLEFDSTTFNNAFSSSAADVKELFAGVGAMMEDAADALADGIDGSIKLHQDTLASSISSLGQREINVQAQLDRRRADLINQFTKMEEALSRIQSQGNWLSSQLSSLYPG